MTTWDMETVHNVGRLSAEARVDRAVLEVARVDVIEATRRKVAHEIIDAARALGAVEVHPDDIEAVELGLDENETYVLLGFRWRPFWRAIGAEIELRGGYADGETLTVRHDQLRRGIEVQLPLPALSVREDDTEPLGLLSRTQHYELAGWRETERRWVMDS